MGNLCSSERDPFSQPGRPLGTTPTTPATATTPKSARKVGGPPRTLGGSSPNAPTSQSSPGGRGGGGGGGGDGNDARARAAAAAEVCQSHLMPTNRAVATMRKVLERSNVPNQARFQKSTQGGGKLQAALQQQRAMTDVEVLKQGSETERRQRDMDQSVNALSHS